MPDGDDLDERVLRGGWQTDVREAGGVVYRAPGPQSATVIALLHHLEHVGFAAAPRPVGDGFAPDGREALGFIDGESPQPHPWSEEAAWRVGALVGELHRATASFVPPSPTTWRPWAADGYPIMWAITWRARAAAWMLDHRPLLERALRAH